MRRAALCLLAALAAFAAEDPGGWTKAKWGMTDDQLLAAFPEQAVRLDPPEQNGARVAIRSIDLAGAKFDVYFIPSDAGLRKVVLTAQHQPATSLDFLFQTVQNLLVDKYGRPWRSDESAATSLQWSFPTTTIVFDRMRVSGFGTQFLSLIYTRKSPSPTSDNL